MNRGREAAGKPDPDGAADPAQPERKARWAARACRRMPDGSAVYVVGDRDPSIRLDLFLKERIPRLSRRRIQEAITCRVEAPGHGRVRPATLLRPGDTVITSGVVAVSARSVSQTTRPRCFWVVSRASAARAWPASTPSALTSARRSTRIRRCASLSIPLRTNFRRRLLRLS